MLKLGIFDGCDLTNKGAGALPQEIIEFLLSPGGHSLLIKGDAGTGKTTMALQMCEALSDQQPEYYLSSRVSDVSLYRQFPWLEERVRNNQITREGMAFTRRPSGRNQRRNGLRLPEPQVDRKELNRLEGQIEAGEMGEEDSGAVLQPDGSFVVEIGTLLPELEAAYDIVETNLPKKTLVIMDSVEALAETYGIPSYRIVNALQKDLVEKAGANIVLVMETADRSPLDYLGDGVIVLRNSVQGDHRMRSLEIQKLRGAAIRNWKYLFTLDDGRLTVMERDLDLVGALLTPSEEELPSERCSFGWSEMDRLFGGVGAGSLTVLEVGEGVPIDLLERMEEALVAEHLKRGRAVLWYPQHTLNYAELPEQLGGRGADMTNLHILDVRVADEHPFVSKIEGQDLASDLRWDSIKYLLRGGSGPYLSLMGLDALESVYGPIAPKLSNHIDTMRRGGHLVVLEATDQSQGLGALAHHARLHLRIENLNGSVILRGKKPSTICHSLSVKEGSLRWTPML